jgi:hypothetical protein
MAPEQLLSGEFGPASDVFSLGSILHYAATAAGPYGRGGAQELYARAIAVGPTVAPDLPDAIAVPITRALSKDPASRPSATELVTEFENEPGEKPVPGWLPGNVTQELLTLATEALSTASAAFNALPQNGPQDRPAFAPPGFPQSQQSGPPSHPSSPSNPQNASFGPPPVPSNPNNQFGPPSHPSNPQNPQFAPPNSGPNRTFGPPQQAFQQPQSYPRTPPRQTPMPPPQQQRPYQPPQGTGYRYPVAGQPQYRPQQQSNGMGTAGLTLAIIGVFLPCLLIFGVIFSGIGLSRASEGQPTGTSKAGLIISLVGIVGWILLIVFAVSHSNTSTS